MPCKGPESQEGLEQILPENHGPHTTPGVGLTLADRSEKHPPGLHFPAKRPGKDLACVSAEAPLKCQPGNSLIRSFTIRIQTNMAGLLKQGQSQ